MCADIELLLFIDCHRVILRDYAIHARERMQIPRGTSIREIRLKNPRTIEATITRTALW